MDTPLSSSSDANFSDTALVKWFHEVAPYGVLITDTNLRILSWNRWLETSSGKSAEDLVGKQLFEIFPELVERGLGKNFARALAGEPSILSVTLHRYFLAFPSPIRGDRPSDEPMLQTARIAPLWTGQKTCGTITIVEDVSEREHRAMELRRQYARQKLLAAASESLLLARNPEEAAREFFPAIADHLKVDAYAVYLTEPNGFWRTLTTGGKSDDMRSVLERSAASGALPEDLDDVSYSTAHCKSMAAEDVDDLKGRACLCKRLKVGKRLLGAFALIGEKNKDSFAPEDLEIVEAVSQYLAVALERSAAARELQFAHQGLEMKVQERTGRLQESVQQLESFSYSIAHDLRAPIRAIKGYGEVLLEDFPNELSSQARAFLARIRIAAVKMELLTKDLLGFCQVSRSDLHLVPVNMEEMIHEIRMLLPALQAPGVLTIEEPLHNVTAHGPMLRQALTNLLENALKFRAHDRELRIVVRTEIREAGGPDTAASPPAFQPTRVGATTSQGDGNSQPASPRPTVRLWVEDTGIGIAPENHQKVFGIFERLHADVEYEGTGIGLAIVAKSIQRMGGACGVESEKGKGSQFWIDLPAG